MDTNLPPILDFNNETNYGTLFDTRDGQSYPVVKIGKQIWLAENFRYLPSIKDKGDKYENSMIPDNSYLDPDNSYLDKGYGRLYDWNTAMNIAPEGWKLPNNQDFIELKDFVIKDNNLDDEDEVGRYLKSVNGWNIVNNDKYGFNAKPVACYTKDRGLGIRSNFGNFWSASTNKVYHWNLIYDIEDLKNYAYPSSDTDMGFNVRLIKN
jgi:uncharacterized protein (TIGR02145 family)